MSSCSTTTTTADDGGRTAITAVHPDIIQTLILTKLDGPTLISTSFASSQLKNLCSDDILWKNICNSYWPSTSNPLVQNAISTFPSGHRSFFSDSFPAILHHNNTNICRTEYRNFLTSELISAVDIHFEENLLYSKVVKTETKSGWFMTSPFRVDLLGHKETVTTPVKFDGDDGICKSRLKENMKLSWILIDPKKNRAVNMSSLKPVSVRRHWLTGELKVRYSTVMASGADAGDGGGLVQCGIVVTCEGKEGGELHVREVSMQMEDMDGKVLCGKDSLVILQEAMEGGRKKRKEGEEKERYEKFLELRKLWRERKQRREKRLDMVCILSGITIFISFWTLIVLGSRSSGSYFS